MRTDLPLQRWRFQWKDSAYPLVVSYFTAGFYMREALELMRSCQTHRLDFHIQQVPDAEDWLENANRKPSFLLEMHNRYPTRDLLWVDADGRFRQAPDELRFTNRPVAYHRLRDEFPCDGTIFLKARETRETFLKAWISKLAQDPHGRALPVSQGAVGAPAMFYFEQAVDLMGWPRGELPESYCYLTDISLDKQGQKVDPLWIPVIEHMQANRIAKRLFRLADLEERALDE